MKKIGESSIKLTYSVGQRPIHPLHLSFVKDTIAAIATQDPGREEWFETFELALET